MTRAAAWAGVVAAVLAGAGCADPAEAPLRVFAASSLTEPFAALAAGFEAAHPDVEVELAFAGSQVLRLQIEQGAPADVFAAAHRAHVAALVSAGLAEAPVTFARNALVVIVPADRQDIVRFEDLPKAERIVLGHPSVPVGRYARSLLARADPAFAAAVRARVVSEEANVRLVRAKVALGEADAAIVYRTDAASSDAVRAVSVPRALSPPVAYRLARVAGGRRGAAARRFSAYVLSPAGQAILQSAGFEGP